MRCKHSAPEFSSLLGNSGRAFFPSSSFSVVSQNAIFSSILCPASLSGGHVIHSFLPVFQLFPLFLCCCFLFNIWMSLGSLWDSFPLVVLFQLEFWELLLFRKWFWEDLFPSWTSKSMLVIFILIVLSSLRLGCLEWLNYSRWLLDDASWLMAFDFCSLRCVWGLELGWVGFWSHFMLACLWFCPPWSKLGYISGFAVFLSVQ